MSWLQHWLAIHLGIENGGPDKYYNFWSGFGSDLGEVVLVGGVVTLVRHHNCHNKGCWRLGVHTTAKGHKLCKKHVGMPNADLNVHAIDADHLS